MYRTLIVATATFSLGCAVGAYLPHAEAQLPQSGAPNVVPIGANGTGAAWMVEPTTRTVYVCEHAGEVKCAKGRLP